jgi:nucleoside phosphorylase
MSAYRPLLEGALGHATIGVLVITPEEFREAELTFDTSHPIPNSPYRTGPPSRERLYDVVVRRAADRGSAGANEAVAQMIQDLFPAFIFLVGTAGASYDKKAKTGRRGVALGDVVVGDFIEYIELGKFVGGRFALRKQALDHPSNYLRTVYAETVIYDKPAWHGSLKARGMERPDKKDKAPNVHVGNIGAGEKVLSDKKNPFQKTVTKQFETVLAFEMESFGVARAIFNARRNPYYNPQFLSIRGISDFIDAPTAEKDRPKWTPYAAACALAFTSAVIEKLKAAWHPEPPPAGEA